MRLGQVKWNGAVTAAIFDVCSARPIPDYTLCDLILRTEKEEENLPALATRLASRQPVSAHPLIPLHPREVWAAGATYAASAAARDAALGGNAYHQQAHRAPRPEFVLKGTSRVCVGPGQSIGIRPDSGYTAPAPELAVVLGAKGRIVGYTLANDVTARDLEYENPFYIGQAKSYAASCALGPVMITADEIPDPHSLELSVHIHRNGEQIFEARVSTSDLVRKLETLIDYLLRANPVPPGSVLLTGSGIMVHREAALAPGDSVTIRMPQLGELTNTAAVLN